jgi:hypothetical protein
MGVDIACQDDERVGEIEGRSGDVEDGDDGQRGADGDEDHTGAEEDAEPDSVDGGFGRGVDAGEESVYALVKVGEDGDEEEEGELGKWQGSVTGESVGHTSECQHSRKAGKSLHHNNPKPHSCTTRLSTGIKE